MNHPGGDEFKLSCLFNILTLVHCAVVPDCGSYLVHLSVLLYTEQVSPTCLFEFGQGSSTVCIDPCFSHMLIYPCSSFLMKFILFLEFYFSLIKVHDQKLLNVKWTNN